MSRSLIAVLIVTFTSVVDAGTLHVNAKATGQGSGVSWIDACTSIQDALGRGKAGDEIRVAEGSYTGPIVLKSGVRLVGGFAANGTSEVQPNGFLHATLISGNGTARCMVGENLGPETVIRGFRIENGYCDVPDVGAGLYLENSSAVFVECVFTNNRTDFMGGAVAIMGGAPQFINCRFTQNDGGMGAGAVFSHREASPAFLNCLFDRNVAGEAGAVALITGSARFTNCTLADNAASVGNGGALFDTRGESIIHNSILWNNQSPTVTSNEVYNYPVFERQTAIGNSTVSGGWPGAANDAKDPLFVMALEGDYRLMEMSPCRDLGSVELFQGENVSDYGETDLGQRSRVVGASIDRGAYEFVP